MRILNFKFIIVLTLIIFGIIILQNSIINKNATKYCPLSHRYNKWMYCKVLSKINNRILLEHINGETGSHTFSIKTKDGVIWILHPVEYDTTLDAKKFHKLMLDRNSTDSILVNNKKLPIMNTIK